MLPEKLEKAFNGQVNAELYSSYLYLSMSSYFAGKGLAGFASWMKLQAMEEMYHAMKFYGYVLDRGGNPELGTIAAPPSGWKSAVEVFEAVLAHERKVTGLINGLVDLAQAEKDHAGNIFLQWFVSEQVEEEDSANDMLQKLKLVEKDGRGLLLLDNEAGTRAFKIPVDVKLNLVMPAPAK